MNGWSILPAWGVYNPEFYDMGHVPSLYSKQDSSYAEAVHFNYTWSDGTQGNAILNVQFHPDADNEIPLKTGVVYRWPTDPWIKFTFDPDTDWTTTPGQNTWNVIPPDPTREIKDFMDFFEIVTGFLKLGDVFGPDAELIAAVAKIAINAGTDSVTPSPLQWTPADYAAAYSAGRVEPYGWDQPPTGWLPTLGDPDPTVHMTWQAFYEPGKVVDYSYADSWDANGFAGQHQITHSRGEGMFESRREFYFMFQNGSGSGGPK